MLKSLFTQIALKGFLLLLDDKMLFLMSLGLCSSLHQGLLFSFSGASLSAEEVGFHRLP